MMFFVLFMPFFSTTSMSEFSARILSPSKRPFCKGGSLQSMLSLLGLSVSTARDVTEVTHLCKIMGDQAPWLSS